mmetsp:Transcript_91983/g.183286  ORF Transcript_91983/g.183286 Transcript_91983/m.183286 type:complete len:255 (-) Transcript_91983:161-925(-)
MFGGGAGPNSDLAEMLAEMFGGGAGRGRQSPFGPQRQQPGQGFGSFFSQVFGAEAQDPFGSGGGGGSQTQPTTAAGAEFEFEVSLEDLFNGEARVVEVPHRIRQRGQPYTYTYRHAYTITLKSRWKDGTALKYPPVEVNLAQIGPTLIPSVVLKLKVQKHRFFERVGDDLLCVIKISPFQRTRKLKLKLPLLDGSFLTFETVGDLFDGATQSFPGRGMPASDGQRGKLFVQFKVTEAKQRGGQQQQQQQRRRWQ